MLLQVKLFVLISYSLQLRDATGLTPQMPRKSRAEIQKAYRERQKQKQGEEAYKERERVRKRDAYVPVSKLDEGALKKRRLETQARVQKYRNERKQKQIATENAQQASMRQERKTRSTRKSAGNASPGLVVKLNFSEAKKNSATRKRVSRAVSKAHRKIAKLQGQNKKLQTKAWKLQKRIQRSSKKKKLESQASKPSANTPRSKSTAELREAGLSPRFVPPVIRKKLVFANALIQEVTESTSKDKPKKKIAPQILAGSKIMKRYRLVRELNRKTGLSRRSLQKLHFKAVERKTTLIRKQVTEKVIGFLSRDDNSRMMPGKADYKTHEGVKFQKRYLNDYLDNLYAKFKAENPELKISRSHFCKLRPTYILTTSFTSRNTCLCQRHQNMALKLRGLKAMGIKLSTSPDAFMKTNDSSDGIDELLSQCEQKVKYSQWKRVDVEGKMKMKIVQMEVEKAEFSRIFKSEVEEFKAHAERVKVQYGQLKALKSDLPQGHMIVQMDFAENYSCQSVEEVQSAYWNSTMVTLHPAVAYYRDPDKGSLIHQSTVFISDELAHNSGTVYAILRKLVPELKTVYPNVGYIHYFTDSPTSQYRNKTIFHLLSQHKKEFGIPASWHYFEAGHGKGPCDGVGGTTKRMADEAVK